LRKFERLSQTSFLNAEHELWIAEAKTEKEVKERRKAVVRARTEIRDYVEFGDTEYTDKKGKRAVRRTDTVIDMEASGVKKPSSLAYMTSLLDALKPQMPVKQVRKVKSDPCSHLAFLPFDSRY